MDEQSNKRAAGFSKVDGGWTEEWSQLGGEYEPFILLDPEFFLGVVVGTVLSGLFFYFLT